MTSPDSLIAPLRDRWSPKAFAVTPVPEATLARLFEAFRWAPSCYNDQPWQVLLGRAGDDTHKAIAATLADRNRAWAGTAPVLFLTCARTRFGHNGEPNRFAAHDVGTAFGMLLAQATAEGLVAHAMGGFDAAAARDAFALPDDCEPLAVVALGYYGDPGALPDGVEERARAARERQRFGEFLFAGRHGEAAPVGTDDS